MNNHIDCDYTTIDGLKKIHEWHDREARYVYFKEKIIGKRERNEKKNNFYWLETNDLYFENVQSAIEDIDVDKDFWISAGEVGEVATLITNDDGKPIFREKWISSMPCHFLIFDLEEATIPENLNLDFDLGGEQMAELVLEHCRQRGLPEPIIWGDHEEVAVVWPLKVPYKKDVEQNFSRNRKGELVFNEFAFNLAWNDVQNLLYEDFKYLGANPKKKHALTLLRVPGSFNTHANAPVRVFHDADKTTLEEIKSGLEYVSRRLKNYRPIKRPDLQEKLKEFQKDHEEFLNFWNEVDGTDTTTKKVASKPRKSKFEPELSKSKKARLKREHKARESEKIRAEANEDYKKVLLTEIEKLSSEDSPDSSKLREEYERELERIEKYNRDRNFLAQIRQDVLQIHLVSDNYVCVCVKGEKESWRQIFVQSKNLEKKLTELQAESGFDSRNVYVSQAKFLSDRSRAIDNVASLSVSFLDIDGKFATDKKDLTPEEWSNLILEHCREKEIPTPSIIVFSGNGLHVKWLYRKAITREYLNRWAMLQKKLWLIFKDFGADAQAKDAARVLRLPGTKNCKSETVDRDVRVVYSNPERYTFGDFAKKIFDMPGYDDSQEFYEEFKATAKLKPEVAEVAEPEIKETKIDAPKPKTKKSATTPPSLCDSSYFKIKDATTGEEEFVKKSEIPDYLERQDKTHVLSRSISEFEQPDLKTVERIYCNYAVLSASKVPGANLKEKSAQVLKRCSEYWDGLGIQKPNAIMLFDGKLIVAWKYSDYLPGKALPRWQRTQEIINYHFTDWGARDDVEYQEVSALLPIAGFTNNKAEILKFDAKYKFDDLASRILRFSQDEVREYKKKKAEEKAKAKAERSLKNLASFKITPKKRTSSFAGQAAQRFADIVKLMELRADSNGEVPQGHRELSVFWAMNFAIQARMVSTVEEFDALTQELIDKNGIQFQSETNLKLFNSLKNRFIRKANVYDAKTETLIEQLGITAAEQVELEVLRYFPKKEKKPKKPSLKVLMPWKTEGISERTWYRRRRMAANPVIVREEEESKKNKFPQLSVKMRIKIFEVFLKNFAARTLAKTGIYEDGSKISYIMREMMGRRGASCYREVMFFELVFEREREEREHSFQHVFYSSFLTLKVKGRKIRGDYERRINFTLTRCEGRRCSRRKIWKFGMCGFLHGGAPIADLPEAVLLIRPPPILGGEKEQKIYREEVLFE